jgi:hypothetical protein
MALCNRKNELGGYAVHLLPSGTASIVMSGMVQLNFRITWPSRSEISLARNKRNSFLTFLH